jgi:microcystin-dependent protein
MAEPFLGEIRLMSFVFAPRGWALCNGQLLPINQNQALFALVGTTYGGDGQLNFALPDLRGRVPAHFGQGRVLGEQAGEETHTLTLSELPAHTHVVAAVDAPGTQTSPNDAALAMAGDLYGAPSDLVAMPSGSLSAMGGSQQHQNLQPFLTISFCIALQGIFPSQT